MYVKTNMEIGYIAYIGEERGKDYGGIKEKYINKIILFDKYIVNAIADNVEKEEAN